MNSCLHTLHIMTNLDICPHVVTVVESDQILYSSKGSRTSVIAHNTLSCIQNFYLSTHVLASKYTQSTKSKSWRYKVAENGNIHVKHMHHLSKRTSVWQEKHQLITLRMAEFI